MRHIPTYRSWEAMKQRCNNPTNASYDRYGARGISYTPSWESYANFLEDMGERPEGTTLDRIEGSKGYYKENCRWADKYTQRDNQPERTIQRKPRANSAFGIVGVTWHKRDCLYESYAYVDCQRKQLYRGTNFFEACCSRKSFEAKHQ